MTKQIKTKRIVKLCHECMIAAISDDYTQLDAHYTGGDDPEGDSCKRMNAIVAGIERLGWITPDSTARDPEDPGTCDCCNVSNNDNRFRFTTSI